MAYRHERYFKGTCTFDGDITELFATIITEECQRIQSDEGLNFQLGAMNVLDWLKTTFYNESLTISNDKIEDYVCEYLYEYHTLSANLAWAIIKTVSLETVEETINDLHEEYVKETVKPCSINGCDEPIKEGETLCKRHDCMMYSIINVHNIQHSVPIVLDCPCMDCYDRKLVARLNVVIKVLKGCGTDKEKMVKIMSKELCRPTMRVTAFETLFKAMVEKVDTHGTLEKMESDVDSGELSEQRYIDLTYYLKLVHDVQSHQPT